MLPMAAARDHSELDAWKLADEVRTHVYRLCGTPEFQNHLGLWHQLTDAADSACSNIAEGFARFYPKDFARFLRISRGSLAEIADRLKSAVLRGLVTQADADKVVKLTKRARGACAALIRYLDDAEPPSRDA